MKYNENDRSFSKHFPLVGGKKDNLGCLLNSVLVSVSLETEYRMRKKRQYVTVSYRAGELKEKENHASFSFDLLGARNSFEVADMPRFNFKKLEEHAKIYLESENGKILLDAFIRDFVENK